MTTVTDWRLRDEDLLEIRPGASIARVITPQRHSVLQKIVVPDLKLVWLRIGAVHAVPFEICGEDGNLRIYRPVVPAGSEDIGHLAGCGAQVLAPDAIRVCAGMDVYLVLRNDRTVPIKPRVSLLVQEEETP
jgi:hypothetical protein